MDITSVRSDGVIICVESDHSLAFYILIFRYWVPSWLSDTSEKVMEYIGKKGRLDFT